MSGLASCTGLVGSLPLARTVFLLATYRHAHCARSVCHPETCSLGPAWVVNGGIAPHSIQRECSNAGVCDRGTGVCKCFPPFTGEACQRGEVSRSHFPVTRWAVQRLASSTVCGKH